MTCQDCKFFKPIAQTKNTFGQCVRFPPRPVTIHKGSKVIGGQGEWTTETLFPVLPVGSWCGEHQPRLAAVAND